MQKKKLICQSVTGETLVDDTEQYALKRAYWLAELVVELGGSIVDTFEIKPLRKIYLTDLFDILQEKLNELAPDEALDFGYRIFRLKNLSA